MRKRTIGSGGLDRRTVLKAASALGVGVSLGGSIGLPADLDEPAQLDATGVGELVRAGELTPLEVLDAAIARAEAVNGRVNCLSEKLYDRARSRAAEIGRDGVFAGVPYLLKDETELAGVRRHLGSRCPSSKHLAQVWRGVNGERASSGVGF